MKKGCVKHLYKAEVQAWKLVQLQSWKPENQNIMSKTNDENLRAFYEKLLEIKDKEAQKSLSQQELKEIAMDLGFSENEWHLVEQKVEGHLKNGQSFLSYENWDDAIEQFEQALQLSPNNPAATYGLAIAYHSLYQQNRKATNKEKALEYARIRLVNEPGHEPSIRIISELQKGVQGKSIASTASAKPTTTVGAKQSISKVALAGLVAAFIAGIGAYMSLSGTSQNDSYTEEYYEPTTENNTTSPLENKTKPPIATTRGYTEVPVKFAKSFSSKDFKLVEIDKSEARKSSRRFSYKLSGSLQITSERPIDELKLKAEFVTSEGKVAIAEYIDVIKKYQPNAVKGDYAPFYLSKYNKKYGAGDFKEVRLLVHTIQYAPSQRLTRRPVPVVWAYDHAKGVDIVVIERAQKVRSYSTSTSHQVELSFVNKGQKTIDRMKLEAQWLNLKGDIVYSRTHTLVYPHQADWKPNQNRLYRFNAYIKDLNPRQIKGYRINIVEAEVK